MSRRCASIQRRCPRCLTQMSRWRGRDAVRRRSKICPRNAYSACCKPQHNSVCDERQNEFATRSTRTDARKRSFRRSPVRSVTKRTSSPSHCSHNASRCACCVKILPTARHCSSAEPVSCRRLISTSTKNLRANMCGTYGTAGGRIVMSCKG